MIPGFTRHLPATLRSSLCKASDLLFRSVPAALHLCNPFFFKTLALVTMDDNIFAAAPFEDDDEPSAVTDIADDSDFLFGEPECRHLPRPRLSFDDHDDESNRTSDLHRLYFVPYRWWSKACDAIYRDESEVSRVCYNALSAHSNSEITIELRTEEGNEKSSKVEECLCEEYALLLEGMWLRVLKWYNDSYPVVNDVGNLLVAGDNMRDLFPLQIRLSVMRDPNSLLAKISQKDNKIDFYERACALFLGHTNLHIWDFSGQTSLFFSNERKNLSYFLPGQTNDEVLLELQIYGLSGSISGTKRMQDEMAMKPFSCRSFGSVLHKMNGNSDDLNTFEFGNSGFFRINNSYSPFYTGYRNTGCMGLTGLKNIGNTCFMNSAIQCLVHTPKLVDYFLGDYQKDVNHENPLGVHGELALAFGDLLRKLWFPGELPVAPRMFKFKLASFAPQFSGFNQHDSQEFLAFLLDGLHEDLNRVKSKPYIESRDAEGRLDEEVANEYWRNHLTRNDSIIVDTCQGQYRSMLVCPLCKKVSVTFDPFMYLSLPVPSTSMRTMTVTIISTEGSTLPFQVTVTVPRFGSSKDLIEALSNACSLSNDEILSVAEIYNNKILHFLEEPYDMLSLIRDEDLLVAYRLPKDVEACHLAVFMHERIYKGSCWRFFGTPFAARMSDISSGSCIRNQFMKLLHPFLMPSEDALSNDAGHNSFVDVEMDYSARPTISDDDLMSDSDVGSSPQLGSDFQFYLVDEKGKGLRIKMNEPVFVPRFSRVLSLSVHWPDKMIERYDTSLFSPLPEIFNPISFTNNLHDSASLCNCLEAFLKEEPLGPEDMWYCPSCKTHQQASKKLDLWRLPEVLIIHLKRFSYFQFYKNKTETFIDFPIDDLNLSNYIAHKNSQPCHHYSLYAVINHYGGLGGGHYTAFVRHVHNQWYEFDDATVKPIRRDEIKTSAAYVLFYKKSPDV